MEKNQVFAPNLISKQLPFKSQKRPIFREKKL